MWGKGALFYGNPLYIYYTSQDHVFHFNIDNIVQESGDHTFILSRLRQADSSNDFKHPEEIIVDYTHTNII